MKNSVLLAVTMVNSPVIIAQMLTSGKDRKTQIFEYTSLRCRRALPLFSEGATLLAVNHKRKNVFFTFLHVNVLFIFANVFYFKMLSGYNADIENSIILTLGNSKKYCYFAFMNRLTRITILTYK